MRPAPVADRLVGMECYACAGEPCEARAKTLDGDFKVEEYLAVPELEKEDRSELFPVYRVDKRSIDTMHVQREMETVLKSRVSFGGLKDKRASAVQYMTPTSTRSKRPDSVVRERFTAKLIGFAPRPLSSMSVAGNRFEVVLRECCSEVGERAREAFALCGERKVPNYYGHQRFGSNDIGTHILGKKIVQRMFRETVEFLLLKSRRSDDESTATAREEMAKGNFEKGSKMLSPNQDIERMVARKLAERPGDWGAALRAVPIRLRRLYVQAFQSFLFNRTVSLAMSKGLDISRYQNGDNWAQVEGDGLMLSKTHGVKEAASPGVIPMVQLPGFAYRNYGSRFDACVDEVMAEEEIKARDFYVKEMQEVSAEGGFRVPNILAINASSEFNEQTALLRFTLARGQYATVLLREIAKPDDPTRCGFA